MLFRPRMAAEYALNRPIGITLTSTCTRTRQQTQQQQQQQRGLWSGSEHRTARPVLQELIALPAFPVMGSLDVHRLNRPLVKCHKLHPALIKIHNCTPQRA